MHQQVLQMQFFKLLCTVQKPAPASTAVTEPQPKENTEPVGNHREDVILLSGPSQPNKLDLDPREDVPSVTFKERRSLRTLTGLDHIQSQQRAGELHLFSTANSW